MTQKIHDTAKQIFLAAILIGFGYFAGKVSVYEQQSGVHKVVKQDSALPDLYPEGKELK